MENQIDRRSFIQNTLSVSAGTALGLGLKTNSLLGADEPQKQVPAQSTSAQSVSATGAKGMPMGKIGNLSVSRLISGGNLIGGWAHARDLHYVSSLMQHYNTEAKVIETLQLMEANGVNTLISGPNEKPRAIMKKYWQLGGKIQWIVEGQGSQADEIKNNIKSSIDLGVSAVYVHGVACDRLYKEGRFEVVGECVNYIKSQGLPAGVGGHMLESVMTAEELGFNADFYVKTLHHKNYWSSQRSDQHDDAIDNPADNYWCTNPDETVTFMQKVEKPWIAFKVLAAGAIPPSSGFEFAFQNGADFICVGMFDFQVEDNVTTAKDILKKVTNRSRPWRA